MNSYVRLGYRCGKTKLLPSMGVDMRLVSGVLQAKSSLVNERDKDELTLECLCDNRLFSSFHVSFGNVTQVVFQLEEQDGDR